METQRIIDTQFFFWSPSSSNYAVWSKLYRKSKNLPSLGQKMLFSRSVGKSFLTMFAEKPSLLKDYKEADYEKDKKSLNICKKVYVEFYWPSFDELSEEQEIILIQKRIDSVKELNSTVWVPFVDLRKGEDFLKEFLALCERTGVNLSGISHPLMWHESKAVFSNPSVDKEIVLNKTFKESLQYLSDNELIFETVYHFTQHSEIEYVAYTFPKLSIIIGNCGGSIGTADYAKQKSRVLFNWTLGVKNLARHKNVYMKLCGLLSPINVLNLKTTNTQEVSDFLFPYLSVVIKVFGVKRCLFGSNFPLGKPIISFVTMFEAYKICLKRCGCTEEDIDDIFYSNAERIYMFSDEPIQLEVKNQTISEELKEEVETNTTPIIEKEQSTAVVEDLKTSSVIEELKAPSIQSKVEDSKNASFVEEPKTPSILEEPKTPSILEEPTSQDDPLEKSNRDEESKRISTKNSEPRF